MGEFFSTGLFFTLRSLLRGGGTSSPERIAATRDRLSRGCESYFSRLVGRGLLEVRMEGFEALEDASGCIFAANHPGLFDALLIYSRIPRAACVMRAGLRHNLCFSGCVRDAGFLPNDSGQEFLRMACETLRSGDNLLIFPEGTRTANGAALNPFLRGFAHVAIKCHAPVRMILIRQEGDYLRKGTSLWRPARVPVRIEVICADLLSPTPGESAARFAARVRDRFLERLGGRKEVRQ